MYTILKLCLVLESFKEKNIKKNCFFIFNCIIMINKIKLKIIKNKKLCIFNLFNIYIYKLINEMS